MSRTTQQPTYRLKIGNTPIHPYCNVPFKIPVFLLDDKEQLKCGVEVFLDVKLYYEEKPLRECETSLLEVGNGANQLTIGRDGTKEILVTIKALSMNHDNRKFVVFVSGKTHSGTYISSASTKGMLSIRYRLVIVEKEKIPEVWYKDEGGREKCMEVTVQLVDSNSNCVSDKRIHVKLILLYENGSVVPKQDILKVNNESRTYIDDDGQVSIKFRIEEVSRSHQKQLFRIQASPDIAQYPLSNDVSSDSTNPIEVRSKRNNTKISRGRPESDLPTSKIPRIDDQLENSNDLTASITSATLEYRNSTTNITTATVRNNDMDLSIVAESIVRWSNIVMNGLKGIQWSLVGYDRDANGVVDGSKPLYSMTNPEPYINAITHEYSQSLEHCIKYLTSEAESQKRCSSVLEQVSESNSTDYSSFLSYQQRDSNSNDNHNILDTSQNTIENSNYQSFTNLGNITNIGNGHSYSYSTNSYNKISNGNINESLENGIIATDLSNYTDTQNDYQHAYYNQIQYHNNNNNNSILLEGNNEHILDDHIPRTELERSQTLDFDFFLNEDPVYYVHPIQYFSPELQKNMGFPAYDANKDLIGFYREEKDAVIMGVMLYLINSEAGLKVIPESEILYLTNLLEKDLSSGSNHIYNINDYMNVEALREKISIGLWSEK